MQNGDISLVTGFNAPQKRCFRTGTLWWPGNNSYLTGVNYEIKKRRADITRRGTQKQDYILAIARVMT